MSDSSRQGPYFVDLFAGCGGLSLGLEVAGFVPVFVNELHHDAMATYVENREHLAPLLKQPEFHCYDVKKMVLTRGYLGRLCTNLRKTHGFDPRDGSLDLVVGGPPCQGFSGIGHRRSYSVDKEQLPSNYLFEDMLYVVNKLRPKAFVFENVKGLLSARWTSDGEKGEIWREISGTFKRELAEHYHIGWHLVHAKDYGVPQNRPRVLMVGLRRNVATGFVPDPSKRADGLLPEPTASAAPDLIDVLGDLVDPNYENGGVTDAYPGAATHAIQRYFRMDPETGQTLEKGAPITHHEYSKHSLQVIEKFKYMLDHDGRIPERYKTKKFAQRVLPPRWDNKGPTITATSLPDDYVHFSQPRTLTVREWARLQTFPDWYKFQGKRTTGGMRRAGNPRDGIFEREVPQYTQIGNAVPVLLAQAVGKHLRELITGEET
jgi:DNA (cytosine-5)-methyltransferase 1